MRRTEAEVDALRDAMWQILDDMGRDGLCVCLEAKAMARIAFEPFQDPGAPTPMPLDDARHVMRVTSINRV